MKCDILLFVSNPVTFDSRVLMEAEALAEAGYSVTVIGWDRMHHFSETDQIGSVSVRRIRLNGMYQRIKVWPYQIRKFHKQALRLASVLNADVVHCHDLDTVSIGMALKSMKPIKLVYDAHEIFPLLLKRGRSVLLKPYFSGLDRRAVRHTDALILAEEGYAPYFEKLGYTHWISVLNCKVMDDQTYQAPIRDRFTLNYIGTLSKPRFILELIDVVRTRPDVELVIAGTGPIAGKIRLIGEPIENVTFLGLIDPDRIIPLMRETHATVCMINPDDPNNRIASANKQFEAMAAGRPIITTQGTRSGEITEQTRSGLVIPFDPGALKTAILRLKNDPALCEQLGRSALKAGLDTYNWAREKRKLTALYQGLLSNDPIL